MHEKKNWCEGRHVKQNTSEENQCTLSSFGAVSFSDFNNVEFISLEKFEFIQRLRTPGAVLSSHSQLLSTRFSTCRRSLNLFQVDTTDKIWLNKSVVWDREKENVFIVHGYAGGDNAPPKLVLQEAFEQSGRYNAFVLDYGPISRAPCFVHVVHNIQYVSFCIASYINAFERAGMPAKSVICIGHSIGAHICGRLKKKLRFRLKKIIGKWRSFRILPNLQRFLAIFLRFGSCIATHKRKWTLELQRCWTCAYHLDECRFLWGFGIDWTRWRLCQ